MLMPDVEKVNYTRKKWFEVLNFEMVHKNSILCIFMKPQDLVKGVPVYLQILSEFDSLEIPSH